MALAEITKQGVGTAVDGICLQISSEPPKLETRSGRTYYSFYVKDVEPLDSVRVKVNIWNANDLPAGFAAKTSLCRGRLIQFDGCLLSEFNKEMQLSITAGSICDGSIRLCEMKMLPPLRKRKRQEILVPRKWHQVEEKQQPKAKVVRTPWRRPEKPSRDPERDFTFKLLSAEWLLRDQCGMVYGLLLNTAPPTPCCVTAKEETLSQEEFLKAAKAWRIGKYRSIKASALSLPLKKRSRCQVEFALSNCEDIREGVAEAESSNRLPVRILSFDIECISSRNSRMPNKLRDPIICISVVIQDIGFAPSRAIFYFGQCENILGSEVHCYSSEKDMLAGFRDCFLKADPDIITGYNILNFDIPWIFARAELLDLHDYTVLGRAMNEGVVIQPPEGLKPGEEVPYRMYNRIQFPGRILIDMLRMTREFLPERRARGYKLGNVAADMLQCRKDDVPYAYLKPLHHGSDQDRKRIAVYCIKDSELVIELMLHPRLNVIEKLLAKAVERGVSIQDICWELGGLPQSA